jgi:hypothetical protein
MRVKSSPSEADAYLAMHELRLDYAIGKNDHDPAFLKALQTALPKHNGKYFYETLDDIQVEMLSVCFALGYMSDKERQSVKTKFPDIDWEAYDKESFERAVEEFKTSDHPLADVVNVLAAQDESTPEGRAFARVHYKDRAIGRYLQNK